MSGARSDSTSGALPDSMEVNTKSKPAQSALPDTLQFLPPPGTQTGGEAKPANAPAPPKERKGIWGLTPIAILLAIAVLHFFIIKLASN